ncbi:MAG: amidohydrolase [Verrucomicrobia bacterium]|jgi:amidohydrolase|nr:amidohydrolase [Verrucomicrobiota bacterium]
MRLNRTHVWLLAATGLMACAASAQTNLDAGLEAKAESGFSQVLAWQRDLHCHPELSNEEVQTSAFIAAELTKLGLEVRTNVGGHGVIGLLRGKAEGKCVAIRADMDALPITEAEDVPGRSENPGVMHACGHDVHMAVALGTARLLAGHRDRFAGTVKFIFQPAEEGMPTGFTNDWGAKRMVREGALEDPEPDAILALHCATRVTVPGVPGDEDRFLEAGQIGWCAGPASANSDRFRVGITGQMAHASAPHRGVDAIAVAVEAISALQLIRSRETDTQQPLVLTVGTIQGGVRENVLAERVEFAGTVRTQDEGFRDRVIGLMHRTLRGVTEARGAGYELYYRKGYPAIPNEPALVQRAVECLSDLLGATNVIRIRPDMGGEDFSYFAKEVPGCYLWLGVANAAQGLTATPHQPAFRADPGALKTGVAALTAVALDLLVEEPDGSARRHRLRRGDMEVVIETEPEDFLLEYGSRFDRAAVVRRVTLGGRGFLGRWGMPDEFGLEGEGVLGYTDAPVGGEFVKIGVGRLVRNHTNGYNPLFPWPP